MKHVLTAVHTWKYQALDIETGETDVRTIRVSRIEFLEYLALWNRTGKHAWKFWEVAR